MAKERVTLMLPQGLWQRVKAQAARQHKSASELAAEGMARLVREADEAGMEERMRAVEAIINAGLDVPADPAELKREIQEAYSAHIVEEFDDAEHPRVH